MQLEDYFDVLAPDDIRIKGHRIGIETVLYEFIHRERCAEEIQHLYPTLTLEEVYATILFYLHDRDHVGKYVADWLEFSHQAREQARRTPSPFAQRLLALREEINTFPPEERKAARQRIIVREQTKRNTEVSTIRNRSTICRSEPRGTVQNYVQNVRLIDIGTPYAYRFHL